LSGSPLQVLLCDVDNGLCMLDVMGVIWNGGGQLLVYRRDPGFASVGLVAAALPVGSIVTGPVQEVAEAVEDGVLFAF
jgi:hypothetical protein